VERAIANNKRGQEKNKKHNRIWSHSTKQKTI